MVELIRLHMQTVAVEIQSRKHILVSDHSDLFSLSIYHILPFVTRLWIQDRERSQSPLV